MANRILVVEDDTAISELICMNLEVTGYEVVPVLDGNEVEGTLEKEEDFDLALLDIMLPGKDGFELLGVMKEHGIPVIYITAKADVNSKIKGLRSGAEDYIVKPFEVLELLVRVEKVLERTGKQKEIIQVKDLEIHLSEHKVTRNGQTISLKPMEYDLLVLLAKNKNVAFTREQMLNEVWGSNYLGETRTIDVHIGQLRHRGSITGMGIRKGITLIAGGGYHGKSTLLEALEKGVYDHIAGDGREFVITDDTAWKLRAEDGRKIKDVDISLFINHLPNGRNTRRFSTLDASGSTSQAANIIEAIEAKSQVLLIDEDTSATNFMVRDELMQRVIQKDKEPITPFLERARDLYEKAGISTILVVGSCGSYFYIADQIIQMDNYCPVDITEKTRKLLKEYKKPDCKAEGFALPSEKRSISFGSSVVRRKNYRGTGMVEEHEKLKVMGRESLMLGKEQLDLRYLEQIADREQTQTLGYLLKYAKEQYSGKTTDLTALMESLIRKLEKEGIGSVSGQKEIPAGMAMPRRQEIYACFNRF